MCCISYNMTIIQPIQFTFMWSIRANMCACVCIVKVSNRNRECENERKYEKNALSSQPEHSLSRESTSKIFRGIKFIPNLCAVYTKTKNGRSFNSYAYFQDLLNV